MDGVRIREARPADRTAIGSQWCELMHYHRNLDARFVLAEEGEKNYIRHIHEMIRSRDARVLIAERFAGRSESNELIGYVVGEVQVRSPMSLPGLHGFISDLYVLATYRRHGVGRALFEEMRDWFVARKVTAIELYIAQANPEATAFWQSMGFDPFLNLVRQELKHSQALDGLIAKSTHHEALATPVSPGRKRPV